MATNPCIIVQTSTNSSNSSVGYVLTDAEIPVIIKDFLDTHNVQILRINLKHIEHSNVKLVATPNLPGAYYTVVDDDIVIHAHRFTDDEIDDFRLMLTNAPTIRNRSF